MDEKKEINKFLYGEFYMLAQNGALQRGVRIYKESDSNEKKEFRKALKEKVTGIAESYYSKKVSEKKHISNIEEISEDLSEKYQKILANGKFRIGRAQKVLNLYLKYLWCAGFILEPPHCPFDANVINDKKRGLGRNDAWTRIDDIREYKDLVEEAHKKADGKKMSLAQWELDLFNRPSSL